MVGLSRGRPAGLHHIGVRGGHRLEEEIQEATAQQPGDFGGRRRGPGRREPGGQSVRVRLGRTSAGIVRVHRHRPEIGPAQRRRQHHIPWTARAPVRTGRTYKKLKKSRA